MTSQICRQYAGDYGGDTKHHAVFDIPKPIETPMPDPPARVIRFAKAHEKIANQGPTKDIRTRHIAANFLPQDRMAWLRPSRSTARFARAPLAPSGTSMLQRPARRNSGSVRVTFREIPGICGQKKVLTGVGHVPRQSAVRHQHGQLVTMKSITSGSEQMDN